MLNPISFMTANFVARQLDYHMTRGWGEGMRATGDYFRPLETYAERFEAMLAEVVAMGFSSLDLWHAHLDQSWASGEHIAIANDLLAKHNLTVTSLASGFGNTVEEFARTCRLAAALNVPVLGGGSPLLQTERAAVVNLLREHGIVLGYENHPEKTPGKVLSKLGDGDEDVVGVALDTGWFGTQDYDAAKAVAELEGRLFHIHLKDVLAAGAHDTCRFGRGVVPVRSCVETLQRLGYTGPICVEHEPEHFDPTEDVIASREMLEAWLK
jgi:L-ribulose-5-phosphate 3-epimerase